MMRRESRRPGFRITEAVAVVTVIGVMGVVVSQAYQHNRVQYIDSAARSNAATISSQATAQQPENNTPTQPTYAAWPVQSNRVYGLSFNHPTDWTPSGDVTNDPKTSATRQEFGTGLKLKTASTNNDAAEIEVLDEPLQTAGRHKPS